MSDTDDIPAMPNQGAAPRRELAQACLDNALALIESVLDDRDDGNTAAGERAAMRVCVTSAHVLLGAARQLMAEPLHLLGAEGARAAAEGAGRRSQERRPCRLSGGADADRPRVSDQAARDSIRPARARTAGSSSPPRKAQAPLTNTCSMPDAGALRPVVGGGVGDACADRTPPRRPSRPRAAGRGRRCESCAPSCRSSCAPPARA